MQSPDRKTVDCGYFRNIRKVAAHSSIWGSEFLRSSEPGRNGAESCCTAGKRCKTPIVPIGEASTQRRQVARGGACVFGCTPAKKSGPKAHSLSSSEIVGNCWAGAPESQVPSTRSRCSPRASLILRSDLARRPGRSTGAGSSVWPRTLPLRSARVCGRSRHGIGSESSWPPRLTF